MPPPVTRRPVAAAASQTARPAPRPAPRSAPAAPVSSGYRGAAGLAKMQEEQVASEARREAQQSMSGAPFRFFCPVGGEREIVIVDEMPDFFRHEHNLKDGHGKWRIFTSCIAENANCPVCMSSPEKGAYFAMYLTIIDLNPYVNGDNIEVPWSKKLLVVKPQQQKKIMRLYERLGSLRGVVLRMVRDGEKDASIGNDIEHIDTMNEDQLAEYYNEYVDKKNQTVQVFGNEAFDYDAIFPAQSEEQLAAIVGGHVNNYDSHARNAGVGNRAPARPGARPAPRQASSGDGWGGAAERPAPPARPGARPAPRRPVPQDDPQDDAPADGYAEAAADDSGVYDEPAAPPARPAPRRPGAPAPRAVPPEAPQRPPARPAPRQADPAPAPQQSLAARRAALRGG